jgi:hypothetical protein
MASLNRAFNTLSNSYNRRTRKDVSRNNVNRIKNRNFIRTKERCEACKLSKEECLAPYLHNGHKMYKSHMYYPEYYEEKIDTSGIPEPVRTKTNTGEFVYVDTTRPKTYSYQPEYYTKRNYYEEKTRQRKEQEELDSTRLNHMITIRNINLH